MDFVERRDGYYHYVDFPFDSDKSNIDIKYFPRNEKFFSNIVPRNVTTFDLLHYNISPGSVRVYSVAGSSWTSFSDLDSLVGPRGYYVDAVNGNIQLSEPVGADTVVISYSHNSAVSLDSDSYDVVFEGSKPVGIKVMPSAFEALLHTDVIGNSPSTIYDPIQLTDVARTPLETPGTGKIKTLSHERVVVGSALPSSGFLVNGLDPEEVDFVDGFTEFLGLIQIENEKTSSIASGSSTATFNLSAGALWDDRIDPVFSDTSFFDPTLKQLTAGAVSGAGEWHIDSAGLVTVYVGHASNTLPADINIQYYYSNPDFEPDNKYSIDYRNGMLYSYSDMSGTASISYKSARYIMECDIGIEVPVSYSRSNNTALVDVENIHPVNNKIKLIWAVSSEDKKLRELAPFFSPLIEVFSVRFN